MCTKVLRSLEQTEPSWELLRRNELRKWQSTNGVSVVAAIVIKRNKTF